LLQVRQPVFQRFLRSEMRMDLRLPAAPAALLFAFDPVLPALFFLSENETVFQPVVNATQRCVAFGFSRGLDEFGMVA
jgi:hypothetical protein